VQNLQGIFKKRHNFPIPGIALFVPQPIKMTCFFIKFAFFFKMCTVFAEFPFYLMTGTFLFQRISECRYLVGLRKAEGA